MSAKKEPPQFSACISSFCRMMDEAKDDYAWNFEEVNRMDKLTQDYLHMLELNNLNYKERAKIATKLSKCRQLRRESKDTAEVLEPLIQFLNSEKGRNMMNIMKEILGKTRKIEDRMADRTYRYKVYDSDN